MGSEGVYFAIRNLQRAERMKTQRRRGAKGARGRDLSAKIRARFPFSVVMDGTFASFSLSESGFMGLKDFQDSYGGRVCDRRALALFGLGGFSVMEKSARRAKRNPINPDSDKMRAVERVP